MINVTAARNSFESQSLPRDVQLKAATLERIGKCWSHGSHRVPRLETGDETGRNLIQTSHSQGSKKAQGQSGQDREQRFYKKQAHARCGSQEPTVQKPTASNSDATPHVPKPRGH